jgi:hypothetical protein
VKIDEITFWCKKINMSYIRRDLKTAYKTLARKQKICDKHEVQFRDAVFDAVGVVVPKGGEYGAFIAYGADYEKVAQAWKKLKKARAAERETNAYVAALEFGDVAKTEYGYDVTPGSEVEAFKDIGVMSKTNIRMCGIATEKEKYDRFVSAWNAFNKARVEADKARIEAEKV